MLAVPIDFGPPEILKCQTCDAQWVLLKLAAHPINQKQLAYKNASQNKD